MTDDWDDYGDDDYGESLTVRCPECGDDVYEDAEQCPACGCYITRSTAVWDGKPAWWIWLGVAGIIAVVVLLSGVLALL